MKTKSTENELSALDNRHRHQTLHSVSPIRQWKLVDMTLRDGIQDASVVFDHDSRVRIAMELYKCGIDDIEAGMPAMGPGERRSIASIASALPGARIIGWCRAVESDLLAAAQCGCNTIHISFPVSDAHLQGLGLHSQLIEKKISFFIEKALSIVKGVTVGFQDASRAPLDRLARFTSMAVESGARRIRIADTVGTLTPLACARLIKSLICQVPSAELEFHGHNDLGMATANTVTALEAGAIAASVTVNGIGERSGNAALAEVAAALAGKATERVDGLRIDRIAALCDLVARFMNVPIPRNKPVSRKNIFRHEPDVRNSAFLKGFRNTELFPSELGWHRNSNSEPGFTI